MIRLGTAPLSNSWIMIIIWVYIALHSTPNIDCYWGGSTQDLGFSGFVQMVKCSESRGTFHVAPVESLNSLCVLS